MTFMHMQRRARRALETQPNDWLTNATVGHSVDAVSCRYCASRSDLNGLLGFKAS